MPATQLLIIDPQNDFCDIPGAALPVTGASRDLDRLTALIAQFGARVDGITVTLDTHHAYDIAHPSYWRDPEGSAPPAFTAITLADVEFGAWVPADERLLEYAQRYLSQTDLFIWPEHCLVGSWGQGIYAPLCAAIAGWERRSMKACGYLFKGLNPDTEHFSAFEAEVPDARDPQTQFDAQLITHLVEAERVIVAGEALSHCVASSVRSLIRHIGPLFARKLVLLRDASSSVPGFEQKGQEFVDEIVALGASAADCDSVLS
jgi:nicotinamidase-related amidase